MVTNIRHRDTTVHCYAVSKADEQCHLAVLDTAGATYETKVPKNSRKKKKNVVPPCRGYIWQTTQNERWKQYHYI